MIRLVLSAILAFSIGTTAPACGGGGSGDQPKASGGIPGY